MATLPDRAGLEICQALGIDDRNVRRIVIDLQAGRVVEITIHRFMTDQNGHRIFKLLSERYEIVPKKIQ
jgi:hypothetical protein